MSAMYKRFSERKSADVALLQAVFLQRKKPLCCPVTGGFRIKPRLTSGCSPSPYHRLILRLRHVQAEPRVMRVLAAIVPAQKLLIMV